MTKLVIFAAVAISVCLFKSSKSSDVDSLSQSEVENLLKSDFDLTPDDLKNECQVDFKSQLPKIGAAFKKLLDAASKANAEGEKKFPFLDKRTGGYVLALCEKSKPYKKARKEIIDVALPCASKERKAKLIEFAKAQVARAKADLDKGV